MSSRKCGGIAFRNFLLHHLRVDTDCSGGLIRETSDRRHKDVYSDNFFNTLAVENLRLQWLSDDDKSRPSSIQTRTMMMRTPSSYVICNSRGAIATYIHWVDRDCNRCGKPSNIKQHIYIHTSLIQLAVIDYLDRTLPHEKTINRVSGLLHCDIPLWWETSWNCVINDRPSSFGRSIDRISFRRQSVYQFISGLFTDT